MERANRGVAMEVRGRKQGVWRRANVEK